MRRYALPITALTIWLSAWLYISRYQMLDDALIHWRYATNLQHFHLLTFNGNQQSYGNSSLLYVGVLSLLNIFQVSPLTPKALSVFSYLVLVTSVMWPLLRMSTSRSQLARMGLLLTLLSPFSIRWLTDGMETSATVLSAYLVGYTAFTISRRGFITPYLWASLAVMGIIVEFLRTELALMLFLACAAIAFERSLLFKKDQTSARKRLVLVLSSSGMFVGGIAAIATIFIRFHHLLPDTAVAKQGLSGLSPILGVVSATVSSFSFGLGMLAVWVYTAFCARDIIRRKGQSFIPWLLVNSCWPMVVALASARGQSIQGVRYLAWSWMFSAAWNIAQLQEDDRKCPVPPETRNARSVWALIVAFCLFAVAEGPAAIRTMNGRAQTFLAMRSLPLQQFQGEVGIASDIGFIGYFSDSQVCDTGGLVNGREWATLTSTNRDRACAAKGAAFLFMTAGQLAEYGRWTDLSQWDYCKSFDFTNVRSDDRHYLAVPKSKSGTLCPTLGGRPRAVASLVVE